MEAVMHKTALAAAILIIAVGASGANAMNSSGVESRSVASAQRRAPMRHGVSASFGASEGRATYSPRPFDRRVRDRDSAFSPQQEEAYDGRF
jgi:hypothetical protein